MPQKARGTPRISERRTRTTQVIESDGDLVVVCAEAFAKNHQRATVDRFRLGISAESIEERGVGRPVPPDHRRVWPVASRAQLNGAPCEGLSDRKATAGVLEATEIVVEVRKLERTDRASAAKNREGSAIAARGVGEATLGLTNNAELIEHFRDKRMRAAALDLYTAESFLEPCAGDGESSAKPRAPSEIEVSVDARSERSVSLASARRGALEASGCDSPPNSPPLFSWPPRP
ncbi:MAG: hypothetical protein ABI664_13455 [bacterium]